MGKHRSGKHLSVGPIGLRANTDSLHTTDEEKKYGLKRGMEFDFNREVTADAYPVGGGSESISADFKSGRFISSGANLFKFLGQPISGHSKNRRCQFFLHLRQVEQLKFSESSN